MPRTRKPQVTVTNNRPRVDLPWPRQRILAAALLFMWLVLIVWGYGSLQHDGVMVSGEELAPTRGAFLAVNAATLTGFQQSIGINEFNPENSRGAVTAITLVLFGSFFAQTVGGLAVVRTACG